MKEILFMLLPDCPYCRQAENYLRELAAEDPAYGEIPIHRVNEREEAAFADTLDYYYVPTFYVDGEKLLEGVPTKEKVRQVLDRAREAGN